MTWLHIVEHIFKLLSPIFKPSIVQHGLRNLGVKLPYRFAKYLEFKGLVKFKIGTRELVMQSYNTPIEITAFWKGIFNGREGVELRVWSVLSKRINFCLDVGANTGVYSIVAAAFEQNEVHAFEPVPGVYKMLEKNIALNKFNNLRAHEMIVGNCSGVETLYIPNDGWVDVASTEKAFAARFASDEQMKEIQVPSTTIDAFILNQKYAGHLLVKIDVEGAEYKVLQGMSTILRDGRAVVMLEVLNQVSFAEITKQVPADYKFYGITSKKPYLTITTKYDSKIKNYLLVPESLTEKVASWIIENN